MIDDHLKALVEVVRSGIPRYLQNGGCSNCGGLPHTSTCLVGHLQACLDAYDTAYNPSFGDDRECAGCGHPYYRHFDGYDDNAPVGCKYCDCETFVNRLER